MLVLIVLLHNCWLIIASAGFGNAAPNVTTDVRIGACVHPANDAEWFRGSASLQVEDCRLASNSLMNRLRYHDLRFYSRKFLPHAAPRSLIPLPYVDVVGSLLNSTRTHRDVLS